MPIIEDEVRYEAWAENRETGDITRESLWSTTDYILASSNVWHMNNPATLPKHSTKTYFVMKVKTTRRRL